MSAHLALGLAAGVIAAVLPFSALSTAGMFSSLPGISAFSMVNGIVRSAR